MFYYLVYGDYHSNYVFCNFLKFCKIDSLNRAKIKANIIRTVVIFGISNPSVDAKIFRCQNPLIK